jgi:hypothetical protein
MSYKNVIYYVLKSDLKSRGAEVKFKLIKVSSISEKALRLFLINPRDSSFFKVF